MVCKFYLIRSKERKEWLLLLRVERKCTADGDFAAGSKFTQPVRSADKRSLAMKFS
jgi:hypothetical protein